MTTRGRRLNRRRRHTRTTVFAYKKANGGCVVQTSKRERVKRSGERERGGGKTTPPSPFREKEERFHDFCSFVLLMVDDDDGAKTTRIKNLTRALFSSWKKQKPREYAFTPRSTTILRGVKCVSAYSFSTLALTTKCCPDSNTLNEFGKP
mgnify:FL=1